MAKQLEKNIEQPFADWVNNKVPDWHCVKLTQSGRRGYPDRLLLGPKAKVFFIEFKRPGEKLDRLQTYIKWQLEKLGFKVYVCKSTEDAKRIVRYYI